MCLNGSTFELETQKLNIMYGCTVCATTPTGAFGSYCRNVHVLVIMVIDGLLSQFQRVDTPEVSIFVKVYHGSDPSRERNKFLMQPRFRNLFPSYDVCTTW